MSQEYIIDLYELGKIVYQFENGLCQKVTRLSISGEFRYEHRYHYDRNKKLVSESLIGNIGTVEYYGNLEEGFIFAISPYGTEAWSDKDPCYIREVEISQVYDEKGCLVQKGSYHYTYDKQKLISVSSDSLEVLFAYDSDGKKVAKKTISESGEKEEYYIFLGKLEIGSFSKEKNLQWLRIPGLTLHPDMVRAIAIETQDAVYAPIYDMRWNIIKLVNIEDGTILETRPDPFGQNLHALKGCPWTFCSKRYDEDTALVDFGNRHYDPALQKWTTLDPMMQDSSPYRYCFDNPMQYIDPDGQFVIALPLIWCGGAALRKIFMDGAILATATWLGHKAI